MAANMKFELIEPYEVKSILGPLVPTSRIVLVKKSWTFRNNGDTADKVEMYIDELDSSGNIIKNLAPYITTDTVPPGGPYGLTNDMLNYYDFSKTYNVGDILYLAISIWGEITESKPTPPYIRKIAVQIVGRGRQ